MRRLMERVPLVVMLSALSVLSVVSPAVADEAATDAVTAPRAAATAFLERMIDLDRMTAPDAPTAYMERSIRLTAGWYDWGVELRQDQNAVLASGERRIYLAAGTYRWVCLLDPVSNGDWFPATYYSTCRLQRSGYQTAYVSFDQGADVYDGPAAWISFLVPQF